jgi:fructoselysine-6-P-deglycase FrlB-like protein
MSDSVVKLEPIKGGSVDAAKRVVAERDRAREVTRRIVERGIDNVYFVGCGGSLFATYPVQFLLDTVAENLTACNLTSNEFNFRRPSRLGARSLVVVVSHTGSTKETIVAIDTARKAGAAVLGVTGLLESPLGSSVDEVFTYGSEHTVWDRTDILLANIGHGLIEASGTTEDTEMITTAYDALPEAMLKGLNEQESHCHEIATQLQDAPIIYVLGAGPVEGVARALSMCSLQEMQWKNSAAFNTGEFFHGAFEVVTEDVPVILFAGEDRTRPMADRALDFLHKYTKKAFLVDSRDLTLPGVPQGARAEVAPIALGAIAFRLAQHFATLRNHDLGLRRYMSKVEY